MLLARGLPACDGAVKKSKPTTLHMPSQSSQSIGVITKIGGHSGIHSLTHMHMEAEKHMTVGFKRFYNLQLTDHVVTTFTNHNANNTHTTIVHISDLAEPEIEHTIEKKDCWSPKTLQRSARCQE